MLKFAYALTYLISLVQAAPLSEYIQLNSSGPAAGLGLPGVHVSFDHNPLPFVGLGEKLDDRVSQAEDSYSLTPDHPGVFWYEQIIHNGISPFIPGGEKWKVFRNVVTEYGADKTGEVDAQPALQNAINDGSRDTNSFGTTGQPAVIYIPQGTYFLNSPLQLLLGTVLMGDPLNPPILKARSNFRGNTLIYAKDPHCDSTTTFYIAVKNLQLESTNIDKDKNFTLLDWSVSQGTQLVSLVFNMPTFSTGHTGIAMPEGGSGTHMSDLIFKGGAIGINVSNQQYQITSASFHGCKTGMLITGCFSCVFIGLDFQNNAIGIDMSPSGGHSVTLLDSTASHAGTVIKTQAVSTGDHSLIIENFAAHDECSTIVSADGKHILSGGVSETWIYGNVYTSEGLDSGSHQNGTIHNTSRPDSLTMNEKYIHIAAPAYQDYSLAHFVNVKNVPGLSVYGDGTHDDTNSLNAIITKYVSCKILFFPAGTYLVSSTLHFPPGSRMVGEAWSAISAAGPYFKDSKAPRPLIQVGHPGERGVAQFSNMLFTVSDILPGCILLEVNMAGTNPGDVAFWNTHLRVGGAAGSKVQTNCAEGAGKYCQAAFMMVHLTESSSAYIENMWAWTADHDLDGQNKQTISTGRGMLVEATAGTWLHGTAVEHSTLYQYNFHNARNVFVGLQQSETPYWQGSGSSYLAPAPWIPSATYGDPDFSNCNGADAQCRMAWYNYITGSKDVAIYGSAFWTFFNAGKGNCQGSFCQTNAAWVGNTTGLAWYNLNTHENLDMVITDESKTVSAHNNPGSWGAVVAAYLAHC